MLRISLAICCFTILGVFLAGRGKSGLATNYPEKLSDWHIFEGRMALLKPVAGVVPYALNTPLFSDYAEKARFVRLSKGASINYKRAGVFDFPPGTLLIKTFYYPVDLRKPGEKRNIIETRLLINEAGKWSALTYVWNNEQTEAHLEIAGDDRAVRFLDHDGQTREFNYIIPNQNQCKGCHNVNEQLLPIGPTAGQLNGDFAYTSGTQNQLAHWQSAGLLKGLPKEEAIPQTPIWNNPATGNLHSRARAYLAVNCAHCHSREGPARTSGLFLAEDEKDTTALGVHKSPVAAGKGSGGRLVDIHPGNAKASILWYRMQSSDPGERMPELGKTLVHKEGVELIRAWIDQMQ